MNHRRTARSACRALTAVTPRSPRHTPGPWTYRQPAYDRMRGLPVTRVEIVREGANGVFKPYIADVRSLGEHGEDNTLANARLIAASPVLLSACLIALGEMLREKPSWAMIYDALMSAVEQATNEAANEEPDPVR